MQLNILRYEDVGEYMIDMMEAKVRNVGIQGFDEYFNAYFLAKDTDPAYVLVKMILDNLIKAGNLEVLDLDLYLMHSMGKFPVIDNIDLSGIHLINRQ